ncbi:MAG: homoserine kinase type II [Kiritimatiellia bacterium]|jgi:homoserine kinase type II
MPQELGAHAVWVSKVDDVCAAFGLMDRTDLMPLRGGTANISFTVGSTQRVILTFCVDKTVDEARRLVQLLDHLFDHGFSSNRVLRTLDGAALYLVEGIAVVAKRFIDGATVQAVDGTLAPRIGALIGRLHLVPAPGWLRTEHGMGRSDMIGLAAGARHADFAAWLDQVVVEQDWAWDALPRGFVHGDLFPDNLVLGEHQLVAIDFEESCQHPFVFDIGMALVGLAHIESLSPYAVRQVVGGYHAVRPLDAAELQAIPTMFECAAAATGSWRYRTAQRAGAPRGEVRDWRKMRAVYDDSRAWRRDGRWSEALDTA